MRFSTSFTIIAIRLAPLCVFSVAMVMFKSLVVVVLFSWVQVATAASERIKHVIVLMLENR